MEITNQKLCTGCGACVSSCPKKCISLQNNTEGFCYPIIDTKACIKCNRCKKVCPQNEPVIVTNNTDKIETFAFKATDDNIINNSSSGGAFYFLAKEILKDGGVVFGVALSNDCKYALHTKVSKVSDLYKLQGSKYLQSRNQNIYQDVKFELDSGRMVLFSGTPCQINGLKSFLPANYNNLVCIEVICHGVPSEKLWIKYLEFLEKKYNKRIYSVNFREKELGWNNFGLKIKCDGIEQFLPLTKDPYLRIFLNDNCLRLSCYNCRAKENTSKADISLGDFWGIENLIPQFNDDKGVSLILLNNDKGKVLFNSIVNQCECEYKSVKFDDAKKMNPGGFFL